MKSEEKRETIIDGLLSLCKSSTERVEHMSNEIMSVILAAGHEKPMNSSIPKAVHAVCGKPMAGWVLDAARGAGIEKNVMVVGTGAQQVQEVFGDQVEYAYQDEPKGTGHALACAREAFEHSSTHVVVLPADVPMIDSDTLSGAIEYHREFGNEATIITAVIEDPHGYGRIIRNSAGDVAGIVEHVDANQSELEIKEINSSIYIFNTDALCYALDHLDSIRDEFDRDNLIRTVEVLIKSGRRVGAYDVDDPCSIFGVNDRIQLYEADAMMRWRINCRHMENGVTIRNPETTYIEADVKIGRDTVIEPNVTLRGKTEIGEGVLVGANSIITNSKIADGADVLCSVLVDSEVGSGTHVGPFAYMRPNSKVGKNVKVGDFVEIKNATIDDGTKISHLTYVGDSDVGKGVNFGCGCVTVNYDGSKKYRTIIEDHAFIGCNTNLVSPVRVGENAYIAAGSTITDEVPGSNLAIARSRQINKSNWKDRRNQGK